MSLRSVEDAGETAGGVIARVSFWSAVLTALLAATSFGVAVTTPPRSGPFAPPGSAIAFPYADAARFVPRDFLWMYPSLLMMLAFLVLAACLRERAPHGRALFGTVGLCLAAVSAAVIWSDYLIQLQTVQPALLKGEGASVVALSQYNPHGVFITLENLGFLAMSLSFAFLAPCLGASRGERVTRGLFLATSALSVIAFVGMSVYFGFDLEYRFEVTVILLDWLTLIVSGILLAVAFARPPGGEVAPARDRFERSG